MPSRRTERASEAIRETVSTAILFGLRDPRIKNVTVLSAEVSGDLRNAKVYVSVMGDMKTQALTMKGLTAARGFIQAKVADRLQTKQTPVLTFVLDQGVKKSIEASRLLRESLPPGTPLPLVDSTAADPRDAGSSADGSDLDEMAADDFDDAEMEFDEDEDDDEWDEDAPDGMDDAAGETRQP